MTGIKQYRGVFLGLPSYGNFDCPSFNCSLLKVATLLRTRNYKIDGISIIGVPYIQQARNMVVKAFLESRCRVLLFLDDDLSWEPESLIKLLETPGRVVAGAYRKKQDDIDYAVRIKVGSHGIPLTRPDGCIASNGIATGFLKIERQVFAAIKEGYSKLSYGKDMFDFFPQGIYNHRWVGEDYAFCNMWIDLGGKIWVVPDIDFTHHNKTKMYSGNYHEYLKSLPGKLER